MNGSARTSVRARIETSLIRITRNNLTRSARTSVRARIETKSVIPPYLFHLVAPAPRCGRGLKPFTRRPTRRDNDVAPAPRCGRGLKLGEILAVAMQRTAQRDIRIRRPGVAIRIGAGLEARPGELQHLLADGQQRGLRAFAERDQPVECVDRAGVGYFNFKHSVLSCFLSRAVVSNGNGCGHASAGMIRFESGAAHGTTYRATNICSHHSAIPPANLAA